MEEKGRGKEPRIGERMGTAERGKRSKGGRDRAKERERKGKGEGRIRGGGAEK